MFFDFQVKLWWPTTGYAPNLLKSQGWIKISSVNELSPVLIRLLPQILVSGHWRRMLVSCGTGKGLGMRFSWDNYEHGGHIHNIMFTFLDLLQLAPVHTVHRQQHCSIRRTINTRLRRAKATLSRLPPCNSIWYVWIWFKWKCVPFQNMSPQRSDPWSLTNRL